MKMKPEKVERVAKAIAKAEYPECRWSYWSPITRERYRSMARTAIEEASHEDEA